MTLHNCNKKTSRIDTEGSFKSRHPAPDIGFAVTAVPVTWIQAVCLGLLLQLRLRHMFRARNIRSKKTFYSIAQA